MQLHQLQPGHPLKNKKPRRGRGGKRGTYSGRGQKGQKARAGHRIRPAERDFILRIPKLRGYKNKPLRPKAQVINIGDLNKIEGNIINAKILAEKKLVNPNEKTPIKILGGGETKRAFEIQGLKISENAKKKIQAAGGKIKGLVEKFKPKA